MKLTKQILDTIKRRDKVYKVFDGHGLHIEIPPRGKIRWRYKFVFNGRENRLSLGLYPDVGLMEARRKHMEMREKIENGIDPSLERSRVKKFKAETVREQHLLNYISELEQIIHETKNSLKEMIEQL